MCPKKRKNVLLITTLHRYAAVSTREDKKPYAILEYNRNQGGVDNLDKVTGTYSCQRKTARWPNRNSIKSAVEIGTILRSRFKGDERK